MHLRLYINDMSPRELDGMRTNLLEASRPIRHIVGQWVFRSDTVRTCIPGAKITNKWVSTVICRKEGEENGREKK
jgi:hypothetical protein